MATPVEYLPDCEQTDIVGLLQSLKYPRCIEIKALTGIAEYHKIWTLSFAEGTLPSKHTVGKYGKETTQASDLILRVAGSHIPQIKTDNEVAILTWLRDQTSIPVPEILHFDRTRDNPLRCEYMIMTKVSGVIASGMYDQISADKMDEILRQLAEYHLELFRLPFNHCGGLRISSDGSVVSGPCVEETLWHLPDIERYWPPTESFDSLNPSGRDGYPSYTRWISAYVEKYVHGLQSHPSLSWISNKDIGMLESFLDYIQEPEVADGLNKTPLRLAHRDLHFGQIMIDPETCRITGILDWEFAQVVPVPLWRRSFLWNAQPSDPNSSAKRDALLKRWENIVENMDGGQRMLDAAKWTSDKQEAAWDVCNYLRCVVEVCPRGKQLQESRIWWGRVLQSLDAFDIK